MNTTRLDIAALAQRKKFRRKVRGVAAALLPFEPDGRIAVDAFQQHLAATHGRSHLNQPAPLVRGVSPSSPGKKRRKADAGAWTALVSPLVSQRT